MNQRSIIDMEHEFKGLYVIKELEFFNPHTARIAKYKLCCDNNIYKEVNTNSKEVKYEHCIGYSFTIYDDTISIYQERLNDDNNIYHHVILRIDHKRKLDNASIQRYK